MRDLVGFVLVGIVMAATAILAWQFIEMDTAIARAREAVLLHEEEQSESVPVDLGLHRLNLSLLFYGKHPHCFDPKVLAEFSPDYPDYAQRIHQEGYVTISFTIDESGLVREPRVVDEGPKQFGFAAATMKVFPLWQFQPQLQSGRPIPSESRVQVTFTGELPVVVVGSCDE